LRGLSGDEMARR